MIRLLFVGLALAAVAMFAAAAVSVGALPAVALAIVIGIPLAHAAGGLAEGL